jgi:hypothetical protein
MSNKESCFDVQPSSQCPTGSYQSDTDRLCFFSLEKSMYPSTDSVSNVHTHTHTAVDIDVEYEQNRSTYIYIYIYIYIYQENRITSFYYTESGKAGVNQK